MGFGLGHSWCTSVTAKEPNGDLSRGSAAANTCSLGKTPACSSYLLWDWLLGMLAGVLIVLGSERGGVGEASKLTPILRSLRAAAAEPLAWRWWRYLWLSSEFGGYVT